MGELSTAESPAGRDRCGCRDRVWHLADRRVDARRHPRSRSRRTTSSTSGLGAASVRCWSSWPASQRGWPLRRGGQGPVSEEFPGVRILRARSGAPLARRPSKKFRPPGSGEGARRVHHDPPCGSARKKRPLPPAGGWGRGGKGELRTPTPNATAAGSGGIHRGPGRPPAGAARWPAGPGPQHPRGRS